MHGLRSLELVVEEARKAGKYLFIWDKQGSVGTFMNYKGMLASVAPETVKMAMGRQTKEDVAEFVRKWFVQGMRQGDKLCLDIDSSRPNFADMTTEGTFNAEQFFNFEHMKHSENYMPYVRPEENHGVGGINPGCGYNRMDSFSMTMRSGVDNEEDLMQ